MESFIYFIGAVVCCIVGAIVAYLTVAMFVCWAVCCYEELMTARSKRICQIEDRISKLEEGKMDEFDN